MSGPWETVFEGLDEADAAVQQMDADEEFFLSLQSDLPERYQPSPHMTSMATHLQGIYTGLESALKDVVGHYDGRLPEGHDWHLELMKRAATPNTERGAIVSVETHKVLRELCGFRHVVRVHYGSKLLGPKVFPNVPLARDAAVRLRADLTAFKASLEREAAPAAVPMLGGGLVTPTADSFPAHDSESVALSPARRRPRGPR